MDKKILELMENIMKPKCSECGANLPTYPYYDEDYEIRICEKCGKFHEKEIWGSRKWKKKQSKKSKENC